MRREEKMKGMFGKKLSFSLHVHAPLTEEQLFTIRKHSLELHEVYCVEGEPRPGGRLSVKGLHEGYELEFETLEEMVSAESEIVDACRSLKAFIDEAQDTNKETVIEI